MVRFMMSYSTLLISFWGYALNTAMYLLNLVPSKSVPKTHVELWNRRKPSMRHLYIWGYPAYVLKGKESLTSYSLKQKWYSLQGIQKELFEVYSIVIKIIKCLLVQMPNFQKMTT